jgi:hypothetical protein
MALLREQRPRKATSSSEKEKQFVWDDKKMNLVEARIKKPTKNKRLNMKSVVESLPQVGNKELKADELITKNIESKQPRRIPKKELLRFEAENFKKVLSHKAFKDNPALAISTHLTHKFSERNK